MERLARLLPHDLLWGMTTSALAPDAPSWAVDALSHGQPVVVRRATGVAGSIAVGIRGRQREQRLAAWMPAAQLQRCVSPEALTDAVGPPRDWPALQALRQVRPLMNDLGLTWGVSGSAGFELASGCAALHEHSDLDLIVRTPVAVSRCWAAELVHALDGSVCRVDVQLQTPGGALALREWAGSASKVLLKTAQGAALVTQPWGRS